MTGADANEHQTENSQGVGDGFGGDCAVQCHIVEITVCRGAADRVTVPYIKAKRHAAGADVVEAGAQGDRSRVQSIRGAGAAR